MKLNLGCRALSVHDPVQDATIAAWLIYPTDAPATPQTFGPHTIELAMDAPIVGEALPVAVVSHGQQGTPWGYRGLTTHLVHEGFAVLLVEHPGDCRRDPSLSGSAANLANRPRHVTLALDAVLAEPALRGDVAVIGHSMGGYTALAVAGGKPMALPNQTPDGIASPVEIPRDPRVRGVVLLAPAIPWFMGPGALAEVSVPVMARIGAQDGDTPPFFVERILKSLSPEARLDYQVVPGAGHFAFFYPVPPALQRLAPGIDPPGFDRAAYQPRLYAEVTAFLRATLG